MSTLETSRTNVSLEGRRRTVSLSSAAKVSVIFDPQTRDISFDKTFTKVELQESSNTVTYERPVRSITFDSAASIIIQKDWVYYAFRVEYTGVETPIASGDVLTATFDGNTLYRFINSTDNANGYPIEDSFYDDFDGTNLTNLLATRGI